MGLKYEHSLGTFTDRFGELPVLEIPMTQCAHCQRHFPMPDFDPDKKQSRIGRGFCFNCGQFICGEDCLECVPREKKLDIEDSGRNPTAVSVAVPNSPIWLPAGV